MATYAEIINQIDTCIFEVLQKGQVVTFESKTYQRANINELVNLRKFYQNLANSENAGSPLSRQSWGIKDRF